MLEDSALDTFGEDEAVPTGASHAGVAAPPKQAGDVRDADTWYIESQQSWEFDNELCTLTCLECADRERLRFEILKKSRDTLIVTCTRQQFQDLCDENAKQSGPGRATAAIRQLFHEGLQEWPESVLASAPQACNAGEDDKSLDEFGEDDGDDAGAAAIRRTLSEAPVDANAWYRESQQSWEFGGELCTLTCLASGDGERLRFEVLKPNCDTVTVTCTRQQFHELCEEQQAQSSESSRANAAMRQLFREGLEECGQEPRAAGDLGPRLKAALRGWSRCANGSVAAGDVKALLLRLHPRCPGALLEQLVAGSAVGEGRVSVDALVDGLVLGAQ
mmetsp:Transcript_828/g.2284  ORF Transcript_828/g.2284 Transcript_828/m.2284 type:complete len:332 (+) Transcript_828:45-1040(+)